MWYGNSALQDVRQHIKTWWAPAGHASLFSIALPGALLLPSGMAFVPAGGNEFNTAMSIAYSYPILVVLWGFWRAHNVVGWSVLGIVGIHFVFLTLYAKVSPNAQVMPFGFFVPFSLEPGTSSFYGMGGGFLFLLLVLWMWERRLPGRKAESTRPSTSPDSPYFLWSVLIVGAVISVLFGLIFLGLILFWEQLHGQTLPGYSLTLWSELNAIIEYHRQSQMETFHVLSLTLLAAWQLLGLWLRRSGVAAAGCWLLLPNQILTIAWPPWQPVLIAGTLLVMALSVLVQWQYGFPNTLWQNRREKWDWSTGK